ncbi:UNKNOWN [Stylonychia lemnae]|uniref:Uncharacterized protein n=1 Tax=Stylonychia lemnae TaxID=5949 RepID=A0A078A4P6_STYLE|nr:UNKNOWN [Stylonychia lemnae]|eukprot:CDW77142.1 UNKNOWN [Stylonychia lemnae]
MGKKLKSSTNLLCQNHNSDEKLYQNNNENGIGTRDAQLAQIFPGNIFKLETSSNGLGTQKKSSIKFVQHQIPETLLILKKNLSDRNFELRTKTSNSDINHNNFGSFAHTHESTKGLLQFSDMFNNSTINQTLNTINTKKGQSFLAIQTLDATCNNQVKEDILGQKNKQFISQFNSNSIEDAKFFNKRQSFSTASYHKRQNLLISPQNDSSTSKEKSKLKSKRIAAAQCIQKRSFANLLKTKILHSDYTQEQQNINVTRHQSSLTNIFSNLSTRNNSQFKDQNPQMCQNQPSQFYRTYLRPNQYYFGRITSKEELLKAKQNFELIISKNKQTSPKESRQIKIQKQFINVFTPSIIRNDLQLEDEDFHSIKSISNLSTKNNMVIKDEYQANIIQEKRSGTYQNYVMNQVKSPNSQSSFIRKDYNSNSLFIEDQDNNYRKLALASPKAGAGSTSQLDNFDKQVLLSQLQVSNQYIPTETQESITMEIVYQ